MRAGDLLRWPTPEVEPGDEVPLTRWRILAALPLCLGAAEASADGVVQWQPWSAVAALVAVAAYVLRGRRPLTALAVAIGVFTTLEIAGALDGRGIDLQFFHWATIGLIGAHLARRGRTRSMRVGVAIVLVCSIVAEAIKPEPDAAQQFWHLIGWGFLAAIALALRYRERLTESRTESIRMAERERIARELHDVVAHHVSAIAIQAQGAKALAETDPTRSAAGFDDIHGQASQALDEMRRMVTTLRSTEGDEPVPTVGDLARLVDDGIDPPVRLTITGDTGDLSAEVGAAAVRIVKESVTNARRHAAGSPGVDVTLTRTANELSISVIDHGRPGRGRPTDPGFGLIGMRERCEALGGRFEAGVTPEFGWVVTASLPLDGRATS